MRPVVVNLPELYIRVIDSLVQKKLYPCRSEAIRMAVRDFIVSESKNPCWQEETPDDYNEREDPAYYSAFSSDEDE